MQLERSSGILLHITSLPSSYGIGDLGPEAYQFIDFLYETKQKLWQILPLTPANSPSPYSDVSASAGNPLFISPDLLLSSNLIEKDDLKTDLKFSDEYIYFKQVHEFKEKLFEKAYKKFMTTSQNNNENEKKLNEFYENEKYWIDDYSIFMTMKEQRPDSEKWSSWPVESLRRHGNHNESNEALSLFRKLNVERIHYYIFIQYLFHKQWFELKSYANERRIKIIGDIPLYVDYDSVDVWANTKLFQLDHKDTLLPTVLAGFPPDHSSPNAVQTWNMPIYDWDNQSVKDDLLNWWIKRLKKTLEYVDLIRIDHFRGLEAHYVIPVDDIKKQTINGKKAHWKKTPGDEFFSVITSALGRDVPLIVEDLGDTTEEVYQLRDKYHLWGMRIIEMGFYYNPDNMYCPHNYVPNSFAYTNTHDNPPALLWWNKKTSASERRKFLAYISRPVDSDKELINGESLEKHVNKNINWYLIQMVLQSVSNGAIIAMQDLLGIERPRMNRPGSTSDPDYDGSQNWAWRFKWSELTTDIRKHLKLMTQLYGRDLPFGKAIAPDDMQMKDDDTTKCIVQ